MSTRAIELKRLANPVIDLLPCSPASTTFYDRSILFNGFDASAAAAGLLFVMAAEAAEAGELEFVVLKDREGNALVGTWAIPTTLGIITFGYRGSLQKLGSRQYHEVRERAPCMVYTAAHLDPSYKSVRIDAKSTEPITHEGTRMFWLGDRPETKMEAAFSATPRTNWAFGVFLYHWLLSLKPEQLRKAATSASVHLPYAHEKQSAAIFKFFENNEITLHEHRAQSTVHYDF